MGQAIKVVEEVAVKVAHRIMVPSKNVILGTIPRRRRTTRPANGEAYVLNLWV